jgi:hypothetical protein
MTWLFSKAMMKHCESLRSSQVLAEAYSEGICSDGEPFAQLNVMPTLHKFWRNDKTMEFSDLSRFGLTLRLLTEDHGEAVLALFLEGFPAKTSALQGKVQESGGAEVDYGRIWQGSLARYDLASFMWKTAQRSLLEDSELFLETWPRWGLMQHGALYLRQTPVLPIFESESGLWPTITVHGNYNQPGMSTSSGMGLASAVRFWQTPVADDAKNRKNGKINSRGELKLSAQVKKWPTPCASASKGSSQKSLIRKTGASRANDRLDHAVMATDNGQLNPMWVEWLMGWPLGWTKLKPLAMDRFQEWLQQHGKS